MLKDSYRISIVRNIILRKTLHIGMCLFLLLPYLINLNEYNKLLYYSILLIVAAEINSLILKKPLLSVKLKENFEKNRKRILLTLYKSTAIKELIDLETKLSKLESLIQEQIRQIEREYERKGGYIGIVYGLLGVTLSQLFFSNEAYYGILALTIIDPLTALIGAVYGRIKIPYTNGSLEGSLTAFIVFYLTLVLLGFRPERATLVSLISCLAELFSSEDNLALPLVTSASIYLINHFL